MVSRTSRVPRLLFSLSVVVALAVAAVAPGRWSSAQEPSGLVGDYAVSIGSNDIPSDLASGSILVGRWHVAFQADGSYYAERLDLGRVVTGTYKVDGDTLTVTDDSGLVSCSNAAAATGDQGDVSTGTYAVTLQEGDLGLAPTEDGCRTRAVLFGTRDFGQFVACLTTAAGDAEATPFAAQATPVSGPSSGEGQSNGGGLFDLLTPKAGNSESATPSAGGSAEVDGEIDDLLAQMTACWQTQDADQFLPLLTADFQQAFLGAGSPEEQRSALELLMIQPLSWERAGDITLVGDDQATVVVRQSIAGDEQFVTYRFQLGDNGWQWAGIES